MKKETWKDEDLGLICICAVRYSLGRMTYMPYVVCSFIKRNVDKLNKNSIYVIKRDIEDAQNGHHLGMACDEREWLELKAFLEEKENERS